MPDRWSPRRATPLLGRVERQSQVSFSWSASRGLARRWDTCCTRRDVSRFCRAACGMIVLMGKASRAKAERKASRAELVADDRVFWHGGAAGLEPGTVLLPGYLVPGYAEVLRSAAQEFVKVIAPTWVYVTTDQDLALDFAALQGSLFGAGTAYRVEPLDLLQPDPDFAHVPGVSYRVKRARVISSNQTFDGSAPYSPTGAALSYATWDDGTAMYGSDGFPSPNATQRELGVTSAALRSLGRGADFESINAMASRVLLQLNPTITQAQIDVIRRKHGGRAGETAAGRWLREQRSGSR